MHELPITQNILEIALRHAEQAGAKEIKQINIVIGKFSAFVDDSIQFYWSIIAQGTIAQNAVLHFERVPVEFTCLDCGTTYEPQEDAFACPHCLSPRIKITRGEELRVESIEIE
ncbi:MAG: hydrogenase maturation nickel metallochaperone HypA [Anaerolineales bacterium]|nr:hydrogenase maturation nickel metallochaperone HypA [Anaerolineales bacterium]MCX7609124.1 hydrogenase maturation nickel metallochaperone HypA [Anaerolineales bacterium]